MTVVLTTKGLRSVQRKAAPLLPTGVSPMRKSVDLIGFGTASAYAEMYASQPWVFVVVNKLARGIARIPLNAYTFETNERLEVHPLANLLRRPNPKLSRFGLVEARIGSRALYGHSLVWKYRPTKGAPPSELHPIDWRYVDEVEQDGERFYRYDGPAGRKVFYPEEVIHSSWWSPKAGGTSPLEPLRRTLALEDAGQRYAISSFANAARPSGALVTPDDLDDLERVKLRREIDEFHGGPDNAFRIALLSGGMTWQAFSHSAQEAQTIEHRKLNREEVCAVYDIPPPLVHILDRATFSNIDEQHRMLYQDTYAPWFSSEEEDLLGQLVADEPLYAGTYVAFDVSKVLRGDPVKEAQAASMRRSAGVTSSNEERVASGLQRIDDPRADAILLPLNMDPVGEGVEPAADLADPQARAMRALAGELASLRQGMGVHNGNGDA